MIVLDASALVDAVLDQHTKPWVVQQLRGETITAPAHQPAEVLTALSRLVRAGELPAAAARDALDEAAALEQELVPATAAHLLRAFDLQDRMRVLDGLYVALAEERGVPLVTTDRRLARSDPPVPVIAPPDDSA